MNFVLIKVIHNMSNLNQDKKNLTYSNQNILPFTNLRKKGH